MNKVVDFLNKVGTFYLATCEGDQPRVRPFGATVEFEGKVYMCTNNTKDVFKQMIDNSKVEICACKGAEWVRIAGKAIVDERKEAKEAMLEANPGLKKMYSVDDGKFEVLYLKDATATFSSMSGSPTTINL